MYGEGFSSEGDILDLAVDAEIVKKGGAWYSYGEDRIGQGRENAKNYLKENPAVCREIENKVRAHFELDPLPEIEAAETQQTAESPAPEDVIELPEEFL
jgi:recombination protein RecA